jgi:hypothetical protein
MKIFAQAPGTPPPPTSASTGPPPGAEAAGGMPPMGGPPADMGGMPMGGPGGPPPGGAAPPINTPISTPLDSLAKILHDDSLTTDMKNHYDKSPEHTALRIWMDYGGSPDGRTSIHKGERTGEQIQDPEKEIGATKDRKWERLPAGVGIDEITSTEAIADTIQDGYFDLSIQQHKQQAGGGGPMASALKWLKLADKQDEIKDYKTADEILALISHVYSS